MGLYLSTAPTVEPVTLADAQIYMRILPDGDTPTDKDSTLLLSLIMAARTECERFTSRAFINQSWTLTLDAFPFSGLSGPGRAIKLPRSPLISVTSVQYVDTSGVTQTLATTVYDVDTSCEPGRIGEAYGQIWPVTRWKLNAITIIFMSGYGATAASVPDEIKTAIKETVKDWFERGTAGDDLPPRVKRILMGYWTGELLGTQNYPWVLST